MIGAISDLIPVRERKRRRKYIVFFSRDEILLQAAAKDATRPGYRFVEAIFASGAEESLSQPLFFLDPMAPVRMSKAQL